jgi:hypothetical protein
MSHDKKSCSDDRLRSLLQCDEDSEESRLSALHVDQCPRCQLRLEELAAEPAEWRMVKHSLQHGDKEDRHKHDAHCERPWVRTRWQRHPTAWTDSMARQLLSAPSHPEMLGRIGRYEVERLIGVGGMGVVFKAFDTELNRPVAVKLLAPYLAGSGAARKRFAREARAAAAVVHEHVVAIHNVETDGESPFLVMPYVAGESLQQRVDRDGALELCEILRIAMQTASGLAAAHAQGLVHRDVKPSNILLEQGIERTLLTDFGLARASDDASLTHTGYHPGTPQYMSPEQARGDAVDARSDLFSLGSVIYTMCTGRPPFRAETNYGVLRRITDTEPRSVREVNPAIPEWLERIIDRLLSKDVAQRFQTANEVAELLEKCLAHVQQPTAVALPQECRGRSRSIRGWVQALCSWYRPTGVKPDGLLPYAIWGRRAVGLVAVGAMMTVAAFTFQNFTARHEPSSDTKSAAVTTESAAEGSRPPATFAWDAAESDLSALSRDLVPFESRSQQLWDKSPAMDKDKE